MAIADKLTHLNDTKLLLRDAIRRAGHYLPDSATLRSYPYALLPDEASLNMDFVRGEYVAHNWRDGTVSRAGLSNIMTTTRGSGGGYFDHLGVYQWAANNVPRIDHDPATLSTSTSSVTLASGSVTLAVTVTYPVGAYVRATADASNWLSGRVTASTGSSVTLWVDRVVGSGTYASWTVIRVLGLLVEESRTNLLTYSSDFANAAWTKSGASIDSSGSVQRIVESLTATDVLHAAYRASGVTTAVSQSIVYSVRAKAAGRNRLRLRLRLASSGDGLNGTFLADANFNLATGQYISGTNAGAAISRIGTDEYLISVAAIATSAVTSCAILLISDAGSTTYTGDGTSGIYIWGAQLEQGAFPTSYIPTTTAQVTRAADIASVNELSPWFNASEGTFFIESINRQRPLGGTFGLSIGTSGADYIGSPYHTKTGVSASLYASVGGISKNVAVAQSPDKIAFSYGSDGVIALVAGGVSYGSMTHAALPTFSNLLIGRGHFGGGPAPAHYKSISFYPRRLSNDDLQRLTS